ncbi:MAG: HTTM domain-containing protein [Algibacter sp.]
MATNNKLAFLYKETSILPLAIFRMAFGFLMAFSMVRFMYNGWIEDCYIKPDFHFTYQFFDWIKPFDSLSMYAIVSFCALSALFIGLGFLYRISTLLFFITFTYLELIEKAWYLNHYYFVSLVAFLLLLVPAQSRFSLDAKFNPKIKRSEVPSWTIIIFKLQLCTVYFFGGIAKLKSDWLLEAQPLKIWLNARTDMPLIGGLFEYDITPFLFSWSGMLYDLTIPFLLWTKKTRPMAYVLVVVFHILTYALFNIGMFPWLMIFGSLVFITNQEWQKIRTLFYKKPVIEKQISSYKTKSITLPFLIAFFVFQFLFPLRHFVLTDHVLWTENGMRFAWHVMIMEKNGFAEFTVIDKETNKRWKEYPSQRLSSIQEKQMSFQPDMIWQYAQFLKGKYEAKGFKTISIYVNSKVSLNGRPSKTFIDFKKNLVKIKSIDEIYDYVLD